MKMASSLGPKRQVVVFTHKRQKTSSFPCLCMGNRNLVYFDRMKYLSILLDSKQTFGSHVRARVKKITRLFYQFRPQWDNCGAPTR